MQDPQLRIPKIELKSTLVIYVLQVRFSIFGSWCPNLFYLQTRKLTLLPNKVQQYPINIIDHDHASSQQQASLIGAVFSQCAASNDENQQKACQREPPNIYYLGLSFRFSHQGRIAQWEKVLSLKIIASQPFWHLYKIQNASLQNFANLNVAKNENKLIITLFLISYAVQRLCISFYYEIFDHPAHPAHPTPTPSTFKIYQIYDQKITFSEHQMIQKII